MSSLLMQIRLPLLVLFKNFKVQFFVSKVLLLIKDVIKPNSIQSLDITPTIIHAQVPYRYTKEVCSIEKVLMHIVADLFSNIAHGNSYIIGLVVILVLSIFVKQISMLVSKPMSSDTSMNLTSPPLH
ncbi:uncharacterized protein EV154DRAFT_483039 [Mucor mucedo]|uniref:uncharacterized protein n=1 Tax=Mucor mucedo TaxID=29922 RepID=UPI00221FBC14|nr:uncharacterized protein EV154DRAFT_483039 [Mucor mucedo]KAI7889595.1 hypothetical protein EV154DRAFT_483039 [Mucor mucedo]